MINNSSLLDRAATSMILGASQLPPPILIVQTGHQDLAGRTPGTAFYKKLGTKVTEAEAFAKHMFDALHRHLETHEWRKFFNLQPLWSNWRQNLSLILVSFRVGKVKYALSFADLFIGDLLLWEASARDGYIWNCCMRQCSTLLPSFVWNTAFHYVYHAVAPWYRSRANPRR